MGRGRKAALAVLWVAGVAVVALRFGGGYEERRVETARLSVAVLPEAPGEEVPERLQMEIEAEIVDGGDRVRFVLEAGNVPKANPSGPEIELILDGRDDVYFHVLDDGPRLPGGASWVHLDAEEAEEVIPGMDGVLKLVSADNFLTTSKAPDDLDPVRRETIDGVETAVYEDEATLERMDEVVGMSGETFEQMRAAVGDEMEVTFWQDEEGFVRRFAFPVATSYLAPRLDDGGVVVLQYTIEDLGEDIVVDLPPEDDTTTL